MIKRAIKKLWDAKVEKAMDLIDSLIDIDIVKVDKKNNSKEKS